MEIANQKPNFLIANVPFYYVNDNNITALAFIDRGYILINRNWFAKHPESTKYFILQHELGHVFLKTVNEFEADEYAFNQYIKTDRSIKGIIPAFTRVLNFENANSTQAIQRLERMTKLVADHAIKKGKLNPNDLKNITMEKNLDRTAAFNWDDTLAILTGLSGQNNQGSGNNNSNSNSSGGNNPAANIQQTQQLIAGITASLTNLFQGIFPNAKAGDKKKAFDYWATRYNEWMGYLNSGAWTPNQLAETIYSNYVDRQPGGNLGNAEKVAWANEFWKPLYNKVLELVANSKQSNSSNKNDEESKSSNTTTILIAVLLLAIVGFFMYKKYSN